VGPSSSPERTGASPSRPFWTATARTGPDKAVSAIDLAARAIMLAYALLAAWQVAKALSPPLQVRQDLVIARIRAKMAMVRKATELQLAELPAGAARPLYDDTR
jgi:hypothetical protein